MPNQQALSDLKFAGPNSKETTQTVLCNQQQKKTWLMRLPLLKQIGMTQNEVSAQKEKNQQSLALSTHHDGAEK